ncbi:MAG: hypothetical protein M1813_002351 [Trichoglossum hirsutum]|nr:MAG: hypothetical protein M1813_002351 [Trichoglossum hirsutum]
MNPLRVGGQQSHRYSASSDYHLRPGEALCLVGYWANDALRDGANGNHLLPVHSHSVSSSSAVRTYRVTTLAPGNYVLPTFAEYFARQKPPTVRALTGWFTASRPTFAVPTPPPSASSSGTRKPSPTAGFGTSTESRPSGTEFFQSRPVRAHKFAGEDRLNPQQRTREWAVAPQGPWSSHNLRHGTHSTA